jgi:hypothetical protein
MKLLTTHNCRSEYIIVISVIISKLKLSNVQMQIFLADLMESPDDATLQDRPEAFDCVGVNRANDVLANGVVNGFVWEPTIKSLVAGICVSAAKADAVRYGFPHEAFQRKPVSAFNNAGDDITLAANCADDRCLAGIAAPASSAFLVPMPVLVAPADIGLIDLNDPAEFLDVLDHRGSDLVAHEPSGLVRAKAHIAEDLKGAHALLADQHKVRDSIPIFQRLIRVLKDCAGQVREAVTLACAGITLPMERHCRDGIDAIGIATRASNALWPAARDQVADAIVLSLKQFIELSGGQLMDGFWLLRTAHCDNLFDCEVTLA